MRHLGDITKINGYEVPIVDCVIGGSPCQDLSMAGKREGLNGARSGLFMEQIRIIREMRENDRKSRTDGAIRPRYMVWENVPGALSSNGGEDFRVVLEETARVADQNAAIPRPEKWRTSGCIMGGGWSIAWRILNAQFWGVPQRRRRLALVADFGGHSAPEILFVRKGLCGDIEESGGKGETIAQAAERGVDTDDKERLATLTMRGREGGGSENLVFENHGLDSRYKGPLKTAPTLTKYLGTGGNNLPLCVNTSGKYSVRRLTPLECERLQGYPDGWTDIGDYIDSNGKKRKTSDSARYKALGNSIALPPWKWVLKRLCACYERDATMASLFDGIGGFPLIWEQLNGEGTCLWASEIEEFPMAVTKRRFGG